MPSRAYRATRLLAFVFACYTSYRTWRPPTSLTGETAASQNSPVNGASGWRKRGYPTESDVTPSAFRTLYAIGMLGMIASDLGILWYFSGGPIGFLDQRWTAGDIAALAVMEAATRLREAAFKALGQFFTFRVTTTKEQKLITTGPYARLMHPSYTGIIFQRSALVYFIGLRHSLLVFTVYTLLGVPGIFGRIYHEEAELEKHFGQEAFKAYKKDRWRLVPYVL